MLRIAPSAREALLDGGALRPYVMAMATPWLCLHCGRRFGRTNQSHECEPALSLKEYLERQPPEHRATYRAVLKEIKKLGPVDIDPVSVGIMIKRVRTFCELRPKRDAVALSFKLSRPLADPRVRRSVRASVHRQAHVIHLRSPEDLDRQVISWLAESYIDSPD